MPSSRACAASPHDAGHIAACASSPRSAWAASGRSASRWSWRSGRETARFIAGLIGAAANVGFLLVAHLSMALVGFRIRCCSMLSGMGVSEEWIDHLLAQLGVAVLDDFRTRCRRC